jgi:ribosomal protein S18 acetylase RimI-like enzyme
MARSRRSGPLPGYRGHIDAVEPVLSGWVVETGRSHSPVELLLDLDGHIEARCIADRRRPDIADAGLGGPDCGFAIPIPGPFLDGTEHEIVLRLGDGRDLNLPGAPHRIALGPVKTDLVSAGMAGLEAVLDLLRRNDEEAGFDPALVGIDNAAAFDAICSPEHGFVLYARTGRRLVGYCRLDRGSGEAANLGVVALTVLAAYRRKGIGERLMRAVLNAAAAEPTLRRVWLSVRPDNVAAIRLYEKLRFARDPRHPPGRWATPGEITMVWSPS